MAIKTLLIDDERLARLELRKLLKEHPAIEILEEAAPFAPFDPKMLNEYSILEIIRDWNFSPK